MRRATYIQAEALRWAAGIPGGAPPGDEVRRECVHAGWIDEATGGLTPEGHRAMVRFAEAYGTNRAHGEDPVGSPVV